MIREGDRVRVLLREQSPPSQKYAAQSGVVTMTSPSVCTVLSSSSKWMETPTRCRDRLHREDDLQEVQEWEGFLG
jgi:hypothetical protein